MYQFTPEANPIRRLYCLGSFRYEVALAREDTLARLMRHTRQFDPLGVGHPSGGVLTWLRGGRLRLWKSTFWRKQPGRGALVFDSAIEEHESSTLISGQLRLAPGFLLGIAWVLLAVVFMVLARFPGELVLVVLVVGGAQYAVLAAAAHRDARPLLEFVDQALRGGRPEQP